MYLQLYLISSIYFHLLLKTGEAFLHSISAKNRTCCSEITLSKTGTDFYTPLTLKWNKDMKRIQLFFIQLDKKLDLDFSPSALNEINKVIRSDWWLMIMIVWSKIQFFFSRCKNKTLILLLHYPVHMMVAFMTSDLFMKIVYPCISK